jgi:hypothetical protein
MFSAIRCARKSSFSYKLVAANAGEVILYYGERAEVSFAHMHAGMHGSCRDP